VYLFGAVGSLWRRFLAKSEKKLIKISALDLDSKPFFLLSREVLIP